MRRIKILIALFIVLLLASMATAGYFYWEWRTLKNNTGVVFEDESKKLIEDLGKLMLLPDEQPTIVTVTDPSKLSNQTFFTNAQVGHKVFVYSIAKKAILYDPVNNKIIEVGLMNVTEEEEGTVSPTAPNETEGTKEE